MTLSRIIAAALLSTSLGVTAAEASGSYWPGYAPMPANHLENNYGRPLWGAWCWAGRPALNYVRPDRYLEMNFGPNHGSS